MINTDNAALVSAIIDTVKQIEQADSIIDDRVLDTLFFNWNGAALLARGNIERQDFLIELIQRFHGEWGRAGDALLVLLLMNALRAAVADLEPPPCPTSSTSALSH